MYKNEERKHLAMNEETYIKLLLAERQFNLFPANTFVLERYAELAILQSWPDANREILQTYLCMN